MHIVKNLFEDSALNVAPKLIGCWLCRCIDRQVLAYAITEVEVYLGPEDLASHARFGKTRRNAPMFGPSGIWYVYLCYGMHAMLNIVTDKQDCPSAILIRSVEGIQGPGRLTRQLKINTTFNGLPCDLSSNLWIDDKNKKYFSIVTTPRIGIDYSGPVWSQKKYRFLAQ